MGLRGPLPLSHKQLANRGSPLAKDRVDNEYTGRAKVAGVEAPEGLSARALAEWERVTGPLRDLGMLSGLDLAALTVYCVTFDRYLSACEKVQEEGLTVQTPGGMAVQHPCIGIANTCAALLLKLAPMFGLTPVSRERLGIEMTYNDGEEEEDVP